MERRADHGCWEEREAFVASTDGLVLIAVDEVVDGAGTFEAWELGHFDH